MRSYMNPEPDDLKRVWQSQSSRSPLRVDADLLLQEFRRSRRRLISGVLFYESLLLLGLVVMGVLFIVGGLWAWRELPRSAVWGLFFLGCVLFGVAGYKILDRIRQMRRHPAASDAVAACVEEQLDWVRHEARLWGREALWWYLVPLAVGERLLIWSVRYAAGGPSALLTVPSMLGVLETVAFICAAQWFLRWIVRRYYAPRQAELESLLQNLRANGTS